MTGGAGFIGSAVIRELIALTDIEVINIDLLTYAGNLESLSKVSSCGRHVHEKVDICDPLALDQVLCILPLRAMLIDPLMGHPTL